MNDDQLQDLEELLGKHADFGLTEPERARLNAILAEDPEARQFFAREQLLDAALHLENAAGLDGVVEFSQDVRTPASTNESRTAVTWWMGIAALLMLGLFLVAILKPREPVQGIARIIRIEGQGKDGSGQILSTGDELRAGEKLTMQSGMIEMAFRETGVHVIATAPLSLTTDSTQRIFLHDGEAKLHVPPQGVGFVVETLERKITDLGTSFVVTAREQGSKVLVLDGEIMVGEHADGPSQMMVEGDLADFDQSGTMNFRSGQHSGVPELATPSTSLMSRSLSGTIFGFEESSVFPGRTKSEDVIGSEFFPLIRSGFRDHSSLNRMKQSSPLRFAGVAGSYINFPGRNGLTSFAEQAGWMAWYHGKVTPPQSGRYRFWGYADNQLLVAIDGEPVFEGSRYDSVFRNQLDIPRRNHPALPCLNARSGFASGPWIEVAEDPIQIDILFGETAGNLTSALLLIEREGETYEETFWGQPKWPMFLTEPPVAAETAELENLRQHMEEKLMGSFSVSSEAVWNADSD